MATFSCKDAIDIEQVGRLGAESAFESTADLTQGLNFVYNQFDNTPAIAFNAIFTDELAIGFDNGGQGITNGEYGFVLNTASAFPQALWNNYYSALNAANRLIFAAADITPEDDEQDAYDEAVGVAHALRAWAHFELLTYLSEDLEDDASLGVIMIDFVPEVSQLLDRNTTGEVFTLIESDLTLAESLISTQSSTTFVSLDFITALRARMAAYRGDYTTADTHAASLIANYSLADQTQFTNMWDDADNTEVIFKLERSVGDTYDGQGATGSGTAGGWAGAIFAFVNSTLTGSPYYEVSRSLYNLLDVGGDVRRDVIVDPTSLIDPAYATNNDPATDILVNSKYPGSEGQPLMNDLKIFRAAEMYLIRAEAAADGGDFVGAAGFIDNIRDARFGSDVTTPTPANEAAAFAAILAERRLELAYEGHRYVDLRRLGARAGVTVDRDPIDCAVNGSCTLAITDHRWTVPVPQIELDANPNVTQTAGYE